MRGGRSAALAAVAPVSYPAAMRSARATWSFLGLALAACAGSPPPATPKARLDETVPANSAFEKPPVRAAPSGEDVPAEAPPPPPAAPPPPVTPALQAAQNVAPAQPLVPASRGPKVSTQECGKLFDRYIELAVGSNPELAAVTRDMISQARAGASAQKGDPCETEEVTRAKYDCGMRATTTDAWQACMK